MKDYIKPTEFNVTPSLFLEWRSPRFGQSNPTKVISNVWEWLVRTKISAYQATEELKGPDPFKHGPTWCFDRFGQTSTEISDGRFIYIGGEHEDHYDPDFYIYNDVTVINPDDSIDFYCYPKNCFPPTDFHSATLVDNQIILIGCLGNPEERTEMETPVYTLNIDNYKINKIETIGNPPGWIHDHNAVFESNEKSIIIKKGKLDVGDEHSLIENIDDWKLHIKNWKWERLTKRNWTRWEIKRCDRNNNHLWEIRQALWTFEAKWETDYKKEIEQLSKELEKKPDLGLVKDLYIPEITHQQLPEIEDEYAVYRIKINDVVVRYVEEHHCIQVTVEGELSQEIIDALKNDLLLKISLLENTEFDIQSI